MPENYTGLREDMRTYQQQVHGDIATIHEKIDSVLSAVQGGAIKLTAISMQISAHEKANDRDLGALCAAIDEDIRPRVNAHDKILTRISGAGLIAGFFVSIWVVYRGVMVIKDLI